MSGATFRVEGLSELNRRLEAVPRNLAIRALTSALSAGARVILREAKANAPRRTGALFRALRVRTARSREHQGRDAFVYFGKRTFYGRFHERGTVKMAARPFMGPALEAKAQEAVEAVRDRLARQLDRLT